MAFCNTKALIDLWWVLSQQRIPHAVSRAVLTANHSIPDLLSRDDAYWKQLNLAHDFRKILGNYFQHLSDPQKNQLENLYQWVTQSEQQLLIFGQSGYPAQLCEISDPPLALFVRGNKETLHKLQLAVVGSRMATPHGKDIAYRFAKTLSELDIAVTSGLAYGIDAAAHRGALQHSNSTIAVLGTGIDRIYPEAHRKLAAEILEKEGAIISEFLPGTPPRAYHFPQRNRIISGLSIGVIVVEASLKSGSLITARLAAEQGREVFAMPGSVFSPFSKGCHHLIRQGAKLVESVSDVLEEFKHLVDIKNRAESITTEENFIRLPADLTAEEQTIFKLIQFDPIVEEELLGLSGIPLSNLLGILTKLELRDCIELTQLGYVRKV